MHVRPLQTSTPLPPPLRPHLALALQGGGAYGAFAWGVLDRLLEERRFKPEAISGASAGALNAAALASGLVHGGHEGAREALASLWSKVADMTFLKMMGAPGAHLQLDLMTRLISPYQFNPLNINPLRDLLNREIDFEAVRTHSRVALFLAATNVRTGKPRMFREREISVDVLLASACLPYLHQAVEIEGETYWDGGLSANPPLLPLALDTNCRTLLLVKLTPDAEPDVPVHANSIFARMRRLLFNAALRCDLEALSRMQAQLRQAGRLPRDLLRLRELEIAAITIAAELLNGDGADPRASEVIRKLHIAGRDAAEDMLASQGVTPASK